jgi:hypothetical protein
MASTGTLSATDVEGSPLRFALARQGTKGLALIDANTGIFTYTAGVSSSGIDAFTFVAFDGHATSNEGSITVNVLPAPTCDQEACKLDALIAQVNALVARPVTIRLLADTLERVKTAMDAGRLLQATALINVFIQETRVMVRAGRISAESGNQLIAEAQDLLAAIQN